MTVSPIAGMRHCVAFVTLINLSVTISFFSYYAAMIELGRMQGVQDEDFVTGLGWRDICSIITAVILFGIYTYSVWARNKLTSPIQNKFLRAILILIPTGLLLYIKCGDINSVRIMQNAMNESRYDGIPERSLFVCDKDAPYCFLLFSHIFLAVITGLFVLVEIAMSFFMSSPRPSLTTVDF
ncbi:hypothetical protein BGX24_000316 [Mortierella sp. AD032]|nr:hypothetical protein BGX24_000316 [Mortierella sp. AD032]